MKPAPALLCSGYFWVSKPWVRFLFLVASSQTGTTGVGGWGRQFSTHSSPWSPRKLHQETRKSVGEAAPQVPHLRLDGQDENPCSEGRHGTQLLAELRLPSNLCILCFWQVEWCHLTERWNLSILECLAHLSCPLRQLALTQPVPVSGQLWGAPNLQLFLLMSFLSSSLFRVRAQVRDEKTLDWGGSLPYQSIS